MPLWGSPPGDAFGQSLPLTTTARRFSGNRHLGFLVLLAACLSEFLFQSNHGAINILNLSQKFFLTLGKFDQLLQPHSRNLGRHAVFSRARQRMQMSGGRDGSPSCPKINGTFRRNVPTCRCNDDVSSFPYSAGPVIKAGSRALTTAAVRPRAPTIIPAPNVRANNHVIGSSDIRTTKSFTNPPRPERR